ncbi:cell envelope integrity protein CreD [Altericroceibacterium endophyticum]|uniref:Cell envelope integrity protein CreD n=1 Tax=Altericroceibacterium endophyticum TaxID=1808508 RepID=A0A6I4T371_9SPHN|nr:cell envelope integrity protein CreD [Altericroceibacterium endophyticum]MXO64689.1 cell envelope integrity protein CreD [Altericroceibacterium endophyticum]
MSKPRSPGIKLLLVGLVALLLTIPLIMVYALVQDRENQSETAQNSITAGWGGRQTGSGPVLAIPYLRDDTQTEIVDGKSVTRTQKVRDELFLSPLKQVINTQLSPSTRSYSIYETVLFDANMSGEARFVLPEDLDRQGIEKSALLFDQVELRFGISDPRGLKEGAAVKAAGQNLTLQPGKGVASSGNSGFFAFVDWDGEAPLNISWAYAMRGSKGLALVPQGGKTDWDVVSRWPHPSFGGSFLPEDKSISDDGFTAHYSITNLALGQTLLLRDDPPPPIERDAGSAAPAYMESTANGGPSMAASIGLVEPVDLYSQVDRSVKYGFLFIGFTFLAFLMFDLVGGARVAAAEYLLSGAGLVLFFVLLLAFAEVIGFTLAYILASAAIIGLLTSYSAAVLKGWRRAGFIGALLIGLYALIYVLLSLAALSLMIGSVLLFLALTGVMYATRNIDWSSVGRTEGETQP